MIMERPEDWALKEKDSPLVLRRGYKHRVEKYKAAGKTDREEARAYLKNYKQIYRVLKEYEGEALYTALGQYLDVDFYMKWLALNFLVHNGDYADEVFFYVDREIRKFRIIPWDYDDIFANTPHEGIKQRDKTLGDRLLFSSEDLLDIKIASDPYLYSVYLDRFREVLETLSLVRIKHIIENTYAELLPYYSDSEIIGNARYDNYNDASLGTLELYLSRIYVLLYGTRDGYLKTLETQPGL
jgi:spore coat protein H